MRTRDNTAVVAADELIDLAGKVGELDASDHDSMARIVSEKIVRTYTTNMDKPLSPAWSGLPAISRLVDEATTRWAETSGRNNASPEVVSFAKEFENEFRIALVGKAACLRELALNPNVSTDTLKDISTNLMYERDKAVEKLNAGATGITGIFVKRVVAAKIVSINEDFVSNPPADVFAAAVVQAATALKRGIADDGSADRGKIVEIECLRLAAARNLSSKDYKTASAISDIDRFLVESKSNAPSMAF